MNTKTKSFFALIGMLIIGIIIGALGSSLLRRNLWDDRVERFRTPEGFTERLLDRIEPDPSKREAVKNVLLEHHDRMLNKLKKTRYLIENDADSLLMDLKSLLTEEQYERAKNILRRRPPHFDRPDFRRPGERPDRKPERPLN